jgi:PEP-CTERM motif
MTLYSSTSAGSPDTSLWTSGTLPAPGPFGAATLVSANYGGSSILLRKGVEYFFALDFSFDVEWLGGGSSSTPTYFSTNGSSWSNHGEDNLQFEISGSPVAAIPEPSTWAMLLLGFAGLVFACRPKAAEGLIDSWCKIGRSGSVHL